MAFDPTTAKPLAFDPTTATVEQPKAPPEAYEGWDIPGKPAAPKPVEKPKSWEDRHPLVKLTNKLPEPLATMGGIGAVVIPEVATSLGRGAKDLYHRMQGSFRPDSLKGLNPDEFGAFSTLMTLGAGDLPGGEMVPPSTMTIPDKATKAVSKRLGEDMKAQGVTPSEVADDLAKGRALGKPLMLGDVGENTQGLLGAVSRKPGEAKQIVKQSLTERDEGAYPRSQGDITQGLGASPTTKQTHAGIKQNQQLISQPLYDKAYEGGSIAPLEKQFEGAFDQASKASKQAATDLQEANSKLTQAQAKLTQTGGNVYSENAARQEVRDAELGIARAHRAMDAAEADKTVTHDALRQAQQDGSTGKPGAVWTPFIQRVLNDPVVRGGISRGLESQRLEGLAKRVTIDPTEYTITGLDAEGLPIVSKTPNMRTLDAVKRGMDGIIAQERQADGALTQRGREVWQVREQFLKDVDQINPAYAKARSTWAGEAAADDALNTGKNFEKFANPEDLADVVKGMSEPEKEFMRIGVANRLREKIGNLSVKGDEAKALLNTPFMKERLKAVFPTEQAALEFVERVNLERKMFETKLNTLGNSATAGRQVEDVNHSLETGIHAAHLAGNMAMGHYLTGLRSAWATWRSLGMRPNPVLNKQIAEVLMDPTAIPVEGATTTRVPPHTVLGSLLGQKNIKQGPMTIQRGPAVNTMQQLGGPP